MSQWTHVIGTIYLYGYRELEKQTLEFMEANFSLIPKGSEEPVEYFYNAGDRITASLGGSGYVKGTGAITFIGDLRDMGESEFCEGFNKFITNTTIYASIFLFFCKVFHHCISIFSS